MTRTINTYEDLLQEQSRLKELFKAQKELVLADISELKAEMAPVKVAISAVGKFFKKEPGNFLLNATSNTLIDLVIKKLLLARAGWFAKVAVPFLLKNYSSHIIDENKGAILHKVFSWIGRKGKNKTTPSTNGKMHHTGEGQY